MNTYLTSSGERLRESVIKRLIRKAKKYKLLYQYEEYLYNFCEDCGISNGTYLDCSHEISVKKAKEMGKTELCFDPDNIKIRCRKCHQKKDNLHLQFTDVKQ